MQLDKYNAPDIRSLFTLDWGPLAVTTMTQSHEITFFYFDGKCGLVSYWHYDHEYAGRP